MRNVESFKLGIVIAADGKQAKSELKAVDDATTKTTSSFQKLNSEMKKGGGLTAGFSAGFKSAAKDFNKQLEGFSKSSRLNAIGNIAGQTVGNAMQDGIGSVLSSLGSTVGSLIGTAIAPGIGTAVGSTIGGAVDAAMAKVAGIIGPKIAQGLELNKQIERATVHFTSFSGSIEEANQHITDLKTLSLDSGLDLPFLLQSSQRLEEFNSDLKLTSLELRAAADQSAAFGGGAETFSSLANALGLVAEKGELSGKTLTKLYKLGVDAPKLLSEATGLSVKEIKGMIKRNEIDGDIAARLIAEGIERHKGGFAKKISETTLYGREERYNQSQALLAQQGTENLAKGLSDYYATANRILESPEAKKIVQFINDTAGQFIGVIEKGVSVGAGVAQGAVQGIQSGEAVNSLKSAISTLGGVGVEALKTAWQINSPSKVFADIAGGAVEGLADGYGGQGGFRSEGSKAYLKGAIAELLTGADGQVRTWANSKGGQSLSAPDLRKRYEDALQNPAVRALLEAIRRAEGGQPDVMAGGRHVTDMSQHPGYIVPQSQWFKGPKGRSSAGGNWQVTLTNWKRILPMLGMDPRTTPFTVGNQAMVTLRLLDESGGLAPLLRGDLMGGLRGTQPWASSPFSSLPGRKQNLTGIFNSILSGGGASAIPVTIVGNSAPALTNQQRFFNKSIAELKSNMPNGTRPWYATTDILGGAGDGPAAAPLRLAQEIPPAFAKLNTNLAEVNLTFPATEDFFKRMNQEGVLAVQMFGDMGIGVPPVMKAFEGLKDATVQLTAAEQKKTLAEIRARQKLAREKEGEEGVFNHQTFATRDEDGKKIGGVKQAVAGLKSAYKEIKALGKGAFDQFAQGIGSTVENFVLLGQTGPDALRKLAAQAVASLAAQATVNAVFWTAQGIVDLFFNPARAAADFAGAALFASIAGVSILGGRALAGNRFRDNNQQQADPNAQFGESTYAGNNFTRRATGAPVYRGRSYIVGDGGRSEVFEAKEDGYIHPSISAYARSQGGGGSGSHHAESAAMLAQVKDILDRIEPVSAEQFFRWGAKKAPDAVGAANVTALRKNPDLVQQHARALNL
ncbi:MAG TPA: hypothetical protein VGC91_08095 [Pyrinomonadaceae bacterium]|jgi:muramidase (phage lysozyme)